MIWATQFLIQKVACSMWQCYISNGNDSIDTGLGRVCFSAHSLSIDKRVHKVLSTLLSTLLSMV